MAATNQRKVWSRGNNEFERKIEKSERGIVASPLFTLPGSGDDQLYGTNRNDALFGENTLTADNYATISEVRLVA